MQKDESRPPPYTLQINKLKMGKRLKFKTQHHRTTKRKHKQGKSQTFLIAIFFVIHLRQGKKEKVNKWDYIKLKSFYK